MPRTADPTCAAYASLLEHNLREVADELRTVDVIEIVTFIQSESYAALEDLLQSCSELFFRDGTLTFAWSAEMSVSWDNLPFVKLGMEFRGGGVSVFFDFALSAFDSAVEVAGILFDHDRASGETDLDRLAGALADARLPLRTAIR